MQVTANRTRTDALREKRLEHRDRQKARDGVLSSRSSPRQYPRLARDKNMSFVTGTGWAIESSSREDPGRNDVRLIDPINPPDRVARAASARCEGIRRRCWVFCK
ncbi:hypothetical protein P5V15_006803 [Pogonomyrmex californicus]